MISQTYVFNLDIPPKTCPILPAISSSDFLFFSFFFQFQGLLVLPSILPHTKQGVPIIQTRGNFLNSHLLKKIIIGNLKLFK